MTVTRFDYQGRIALPAPFVQLEDLMQRLLIGFCALFSLVAQATPLTPPKGGQYAVIVQGNSGVAWATREKRAQKPINNRCIRSSN